MADIPEIEEIVDFADKTGYWKMKLRPNPDIAPSIPDTTPPNGLEEITKSQNVIDTLTQRNQVLEDHARQLEQDLSDYKSTTEARFDKLATLIQGLLSKPKSL
jgi:hypothetical protein